MIPPRFGIGRGADGDDCRCSVAGRLGYVTDVSLADAAYIKNVGKERSVHGPGPNPDLSVGDRGRTQRDRGGRAGSGRDWRVWRFPAHFKRRSKVLPDGS